MKHRHILPNSTEYSVAKIASILERGGASDIKTLFQAIKANPFSDMAGNALAACNHSDVYGYPKLLSDCIKYWQDVQK